MDITTVKQHIKTGEFDKFYIFTGDEVKIMDMYIDMIAKKSGLSIERSDSLSAVYKKIKAKTLIQTNYLYIVRDDKDFSSEERLWTKFDKSPSDNIVIFYYTSIDKRTKFWKHFGEQIVVFDHLNTDVLIKYIQKDIKLSDAACRELIKACEGDYGRILLEIDKIKNFPGERPDTTLRYLLDEGVIYQPPTDAIFDLVSAILSRNPKKIWSLYEECKLIGEANVVILSVLHTNVKQLLQVQSCIKEDRNIVETTGLNGFQIKLVKPNVGKYKNGELVRMMRYIRKAERGIKTGEMSDAISLDYVLVNCV